MGFTIYARIAEISTVSAEVRGARQQSVEERGATDKMMDQCAELAQLKRERVEPAVEMLDTILANLGASTASTAELDSAARSAALAGLRDYGGTGSITPWSIPRPSPVCRPPRLGAGPAGEMLEEWDRVNRKFAPPP